MGQAIAQAAEEAGHEVTGKVDIGDDLAEALKGAQVVIDFSFHTATEELFQEAARQGKAIVCGTTGHSPSQREHLMKLASQTPTVWVGNFSIGVNLLCYLTEKAASILPLGYDAEIVEMHHRHKKDAPSGTALMLAEAIAKARKLSLEELRHGREGITGERTQKEIGMHSMRGGDVVGDHTVVFSEIGERIELSHKASSRAIFARGAIRAAEWLSGREPGVYAMRDVLGLH